MKICVPKETVEGELRIALIPASVEKLVKKGAVIEVESGLGLSCHYTDEDYKKAGATVSADRKALLSSADIVVRIRKPSIEEVATLKKGALHISYLDPFNEAALIDAFEKAGVSAISMEMIPRTTKAQKMDVLSSQASLAGYVAVILAQEKLKKIFTIQ